MKRDNLKCGSTNSGWSVILCMVMLFTFILGPVYFVYAQESLEDQFVEAAQDLDPIAQKEFYKLMRDPGELVEFFEEYSIPEDLADRVADRIDNADGRMASGTAMAGSRTLG